VRGEFVVIHAVVRELRLRRGREVLCIYNQAFEPYGTNPATGTAAPDVERTDKGGPRS
jgi:type IV secretion system protein VirB9